ncbi:hypothetical protein KAR91_74320 [Candidatus Pacearchaeota archaeon]|nr:hypothetical protein [Candidatus Pacearchaeota archaeon]
MKLNIRWPSTSANDYSAWYVIIWRSVFLTIIYTGLSITWVGCICAYGISHANSWWRNARRQ